MKLLGGLGLTPAWGLVSRREEETEDILFRKMSKFPDFLPKSGLMMVIRVGRRSNLSGELWVNGTHGAESRRRLGDTTHKLMIHVRWKMKVRMKEKVIFKLYFPVSCAVPSVGCARKSRLGEPSFVETSQVLFPSSFLHYRTIGYIF